MAVVAIPMNYQTVFTTLRKSTLQFQEIAWVPNYEPAPYGHVTLYFYDDYIDVVDSDGTVNSYQVSTGASLEWFTRPQLAYVLTMGMKDKVGGYFYQFHSDGSISTSSPEKETYYWGPIETSPEHTCVPLSVVTETKTMYYGYPMELKDRHAEFMKYRDQQDTYDSDEDRNYDSDGGYPYPRGRGRHCGWWTPSSPLFRQPA